MWQTSLESSADRADRAETVFVTLRCFQFPRNRTRSDLLSASRSRPGRQRCQSSTNSSQTGLFQRHVLCPAPCPVAPVFTPPLRSADPDISQRSSRSRRLKTAARGMRQILRDPDLGVELLHHGLVQRWLVALITAVQWILQRNGRIKRCTRVSTHWQSACNPGESRIIMISGMLARHVNAVSIDM